ncbi:hypothetical protein N7466_004846 [Penicillium verhagenii]|uniref:uncharacterized protein n=1 Tax=Penicillium verhagenii TaxID=1562060 RepID=UPI0025452DD2|nr:uncharacterized protein N7466_004846 [Penicillium verhagenii]KAJ5935299.1 hypothetical protein N7466_004846 [Penicillium verhagenii]
MKVSALVSSLALSALPSVNAAPGSNFEQESAAVVADIIRRALPNAPNGYTPTNVTCPSSRPTIRSAAKLSTNETEWLEVRRNKTITPMKDFFSHVSVGDYDVGAYIDKHSANVSNLPNIAIAASGGGYRAMLNGAGAMKAFDSRVSNSTATGHLGGLLQSATYVAGLSGGSWLVGSIYINNFTSIADLQTYSSGEPWQLGNNIFEGPDTGGLQILDTADYFKDLAEAVDDKKDAGFDTSITDIWGRALAFQMFNSSQGGLDYTWSSIAKTAEFIAGDYPMPLVVADSRTTGEIIASSYSTVFEFNPWEFGTFDPTIYAFAPLEYIGSRFENGSIASNETCVRGYDNAGFIIGTSSTLFNEAITELGSNSSSITSWAEDVLKDLFAKFDSADNDIAAYEPNPFYGYNDDSLAQGTELDIVDGGEDGQNVPLHPLIQPERAVDVIFAVDSSADTDYYWPNGTSLVATYERSLNVSGIGNGTAFPAIPDQNTFINLGLNTRPTFFGCNSSNITGPAPLVVYLANYPYSAQSNTSTYQMTYEDWQRDNIITNGYEVVTMGNGTRDGNFTACVGCAILSRSFERTGTTLPDICTQCFTEYCWNGTTNSTTPNTYAPVDILASSIAVSSLVPTVLSTVAAVSAAIFTMV